MQLARGATGAQLETVVRQWRRVLIGDTTASSHARRGVRCRIEDDGSYVVTTRLSPDRRGRSSCRRSPSPAPLSWTRPVGSSRPRRRQRWPTLSPRTPPGAVRGRRLHADRLVLPGSRTVRRGRRPAPRPGARRHRRAGRGVSHQRGRGCRGCSGGSPDVPAETSLPATVTPGVPAEPPKAFPRNRPRAPHLTPARRPTPPAGPCTRRRTPAGRPPASLRTVSRSRPVPCCACCATHRLSCSSPHGTDGRSTSVGRAATPTAASAAPSESATAAPAGSPAAPSVTASSRTTPTGGAAAGTPISTSSSACARRTTSRSTSLGYDVSALGSGRFALVPARRSGDQSSRRRSATTGRRHRRRSAVDAAGDRSGWQRIVPMWGGERIDLDHLLGGMAANLLNRDGHGSPTSRTPRSTRPCARRPDGRRPARRGPLDGPGDATAA